MQITKRILLLITALAVCLSLLPAAFASGEPSEEALTEEVLTETAEEQAAEPEAGTPTEETEAEPIPEKHTVTGTIPGGEADNDALFAAYAGRAFYGADAPALDGEPFDSGKYLDGGDALVYPVLRRMIAEVAAGERTDTRFYIPYGDVLEKTEWTAAELGVPFLGRAGSLSREAEDALDALVGLNVDTLISTLLADCPYDLYWCDKTREYSVDWDAPVLRGGRAVLEGGYTVELQAADAYSDGDPYTADRTYGASVRAAADHAARIVSEAAALSDVDKLRSYLYALCGMNSYNWEAIESDDVPYGDPWQLIWLFDGDPDTNVVCEGYAKAFQYLCDMTDFDADICCYTVTGDYSYDGDEGGGHMWNIVRMDDGRNYLVDVTNCDQEADGVDESLFLKGCRYGSVFYGYAFCDAWGGEGFYAYDYGEADNVLYAFDYADLALSPFDYGEAGAVPTGLAISAENFPDSGFRDYLTYWFDWEEDGYLSPAELADINSIDVRRYGRTDWRVRSLEGLGRLPNLRRVYCDGTVRGALDVSGCPGLEVLSCAGCGLDALDVSNNPALFYLDCSNNSLTELDLSRNTLIECLYCEANGITALDLNPCRPLLESIRYDDASVEDGVMYWTYTDEDTGEEYIDLSYDASLAPVMDIPAVPGDANGAALILRYCVGLAGPDDLEPAGADMDGDGAFTPADAALILMTKG